MKTFLRIAFFLVGGVIGLCLLYIGYLFVWKWIDINFRECKHTDNMQVLAKNRETAAYFLLKIVEAPDGGYMMFSSKLVGKKKEISLIKLDKDFKQIWEKTVPGDIRPFRNDAIWDGTNYRLIGFNPGNKQSHPIIMSFDQQGNLTSKVNINDILISKDAWSTQFLIADKKMFVSGNESAPERLLLSETDLQNGKIIRRSFLDTATDSLDIPAAVYDAKTNSAYFCGRSFQKNLYIWKYDAGGKLTLEVSQQIPQLISAEMWMGDKPYILTSEGKDSTGYGKTLNVYAIENGKANKLWSYTDKVKNVYAADLVNLKNQWYIYARYESNSGRTHSEVLKFDSKGNILARSKIMTNQNDLPTKFVLTKDGRLIACGITFGYIIAKGSRPYISRISI